MGKKYAAHEWLEFLSEPTRPSIEAVTLSMELQIRAVRVVNSLVTSTQRVSPASTDGFRVGYEAFQSLTGAGTGLWDSRVFSAAVGARIDTAVRRDKECKRLAAALEAEMA